jgi:hypothetical protein
MDKLYKLAGAAGGSYTCFGAKFGVRSNDPALMDTIAHVLPLGSQQTDEVKVDTIYSFLSPRSSENTRVRRFHLLYENASLIKRGKQCVDLLDAFENAVYLKVSQFAVPYVFVHAGVVGWNGRAVVIPGASRSGKSSLVAAFLRAGAVYLSDEFAVFDRTGRVRPFPRSVSLRGEQDSKTRVAPEELGASTATKPIPVGMVIATQYRESASWRPHRMSQGQAVLSLLANSMSGRRKPHLNVKTFTVAIRNCISLRGVRGEADEVVNATLCEMDMQQIELCG